MWLFGISGLVVGFIIGMMLNSYLLRDVPKEKFTNDRSIRLRYGLLNWGVALLFMALMLMIGQTKP